MSHARPSQFTSCPRRSAGRAPRAGAWCARCPWTSHRAWAAVWLAMIAYGGLIPFDFTPLAPAVDAAGGLLPWLGATLTSPTWHAHAGPASALGVSAGASDWAANLLLFAPVGLFLVWDWPRNRWAVAWLRAVVVVAAASWLLESTQSLSPSRFASIQDVVANTVSGAVGGAVAVAIRGIAGPLAFWLYCRAAAVRFALGDTMRWLGGRPAWSWGVALGSGVLVAGAFWAGVRPGLLGGWLPFGAAFERSYDVAAWRLTLASAGYGLLLVVVGGPLLAVRTGGDTASKPRRSLPALLAAVTGWAVLIEVGHAFRGGTPGMTGPLLAILITAAAATMAVLLAAAIRRRDRRRRPRGAVAVERRRRPHRYAET